MNDEAGVEGPRHVHRLREVAVSSMIESLAERRLSLINQFGLAPLLGEILALRPGDQVEMNQGILVSDCLIANHMTQNRVLIG